MPAPSKTPGFYCISYNTSDVYHFNEAGKQWTKVTTLTNCTTIAWDSKQDRLVSTDETGVLTWHKPSDDSKPDAPAFNNSAALVGDGEDSKPAPGPTLPEDCRTIMLAVIHGNPVLMTVPLEANGKNHFYIFDLKDGWKEVDSGSRPSGQNALACLAVI